MCRVLDRQPKKSRSESSPIGGSPRVKPQPSTVGNPLNLPTCGQCRRLMAVTRIEPDWLRDDGSEVQTFECAACGGSVTRFIREGSGAVRGTRATIPSTK